MSVQPRKGNCELWNHFCFFFFPQNKREYEKKTLPQILRKIIENSPRNQYMMLRERQKDNRPQSAAKLRTISAGL